ncbi:MAG: type II toxin-antitoxin system PemK/MazF family toxin [Candidatus Sumerlaeaceae bacterium]
MKRGDLYRVRKPPGSDPKKSRVFIVVSRQVLIDSRHSSVICAPVYSNHSELETQLAIGTMEGMKHDSSIHCDDLVSISKHLLTDYIGRLAELKMSELDRALRIALQLGRR